MPLVAATVTCQGGNSFDKAGRFTASLASRAQVQVIMRIVYEDPIQREDDHKRPQATWSIAWYSSPEEGVHDQAASLSVAEAAFARPGQAARGA